MFDVKRDGVPRINILLIFTMKHPCFIKESQCKNITYYRLFTNPFLREGGRIGQFIIDL